MSSVGRPESTLGLQSAAEIVSGFMPRRSPKPVKFEKELVFSDRNFPLAVFILDEHPDYPLHVHDFSEIVIIAHGRGVNVVGDEEFPLKAGDVFVHHGGRPHGYRDTKNLGLINVIYEQSLLQRVRFDVAGLPASGHGKNRRVAVILGAERGARPSRGG